MSYQVLARKWRPRFFREMVGQEHVLQALINALDHNRLHHAYLFTGTRGVGKTTIARILAKCLNCEVGVSSEPCGTCSSCMEIAQGSFIDLIEVDAASRTKVEDTRELLDNVQYAPSKGRFKVYLIDEVHMLSTHSFNALLKTLEEPPEHVKFLLATTDPQKLPPTILSRCLQFHLKNMSPECIVGHLQHVLTQEVMEFDDTALWSLARSANGSMRDALSLTDQAIAFGAGHISAQSVATMLGSIDQQTVYNLMQSLIDYDAVALMAEVASFSEHAPDYVAVLDELLMLIHRLTLAQVSTACIDNSEGDKEKVLVLAGQLSAEELQLFYQMAILGKRDIGLAPDLRTGFEMTLIRMLTFKPEGVKEPVTRALPSSVAKASIKDSGKPEEVQQVKKPEQGEIPEPVSSQLSVNNVTIVIAENELRDVVDKPVSTSGPLVLADSDASAAVVQEKDSIVKSRESAESNSKGAPVTSGLSTSVFLPDTLLDNAEIPQSEKLDPVSVMPNAQSLDSAVIVDRLSSMSLPLNHEQWLQVFHHLPLQGLLKSIAAECVILSVSPIGEGENVDAVNMNLLLNLAQAQLFNERHQAGLQQLLQALLVEPLSVHIQALDATEFSRLSRGLLTVSQNDERLQVLEQSRVELHINSDPILASIIESFDAQLIESSMKTIDV